MPRKNMLPTPVQDPISIDEFRNIISATPGRAVLLIRHAERPKIEEDDPSFGENLDLTEAGISMAKQVGTQLSGIKNCRFGATPMRRTRKTARLLAAAMGIENIDLFDAHEAGIRGLWIENAEHLHTYYRKEGSANFTNRYFRDGVAEGYRPIREGAAHMFEWLSETDFGADFTLIVSHDVFIAAFLQGLGVRKFNSQNWVGYLHGAGLAQSRDGKWKAFYCVPDKNDFSNTFIQ